MCMQWTNIGCFLQNEWEKSGEFYSDLLSANQGSQARLKDTKKNTFAKRDLVVIKARENPVANFCMHCGYQYFTNSKFYTGDQGTYPAKPLFIACTCIPLKIHGKVKAC